MKETGESASLTGHTTVFVTGGTGLVGAHILSDLLRQQVRIRALKRKNSDLATVRKVLAYYHEDPGAAFRRIEWCEGDLLSPVFMGQALRGIDQVYHCAAMVSFNPKDREKLHLANVRGTAEIVSHAIEKEVRKFCFVSSSAALGRPAKVREAKIDETTPWAPDSALSDYALTKYLAEQEVWKGVRAGLKAIIVNPPIVIGPGDWNRSSSKLFATIWKGFPFYSSGITAFVDVRDVSQVAIRLMNSPVHSERFIVAAENLPFRELFNLIADHLDRPRPRYQIPRWMGEIAWRLDHTISKLNSSEPSITKSAVISGSRRYFFSNEKIRRHLDYEFIPIERAVRDTCRLFLTEQEDRKGSTVA